MKNKSVTIPIFVPNLGCPNRCVFCNQKISTSTEITPDPEFIRKKVNDYISGLKPDVNHIEIGFFGGSFTGIGIESQISMLSAAYEFIKTKEIMGVRISTRPDLINVEILEILKKYGVSTIELGVQSFSDKVLKLSERGHDAEDVFSAADLINKKKFDLVIQLMPGLPGSTSEDDISSAEIAVSLNPVSSRIYPVVVLKNTKLEKLFLEKKYIPLSFEAAVNICADMHLIFENKNIPVIRTGIHPLSINEIKNIIAGPYHPSFGFFVKSEIKKRMIENELIKYIEQDKITSAFKDEIEIVFPEFEKEEYIGNKKNNIKYLEAKFGIKIKYSCHENNKLRIITND
jgi:histone acetyltransferase (RNA polymerase elongator complex component)